MTIMTAGLFKKVVLADNVAPFVDPVFEAAGAGHALSLTESWGGALAYTLQLYFDFSGYSDMAIGLARLFGVTFPANFNSPYRAPSIIEFWQRWHMSLSQFMRDYVYFPLGGNRRGVVRRDGNVMLTMLLCGLWHGAGWTYVAWGAWHGVLLVLNHWWRALRPCPSADGSPVNMARLVGGGATFLAVCWGWVLFRSPNFGAAYEMYRGMAGFNGMTLPEQWEPKLGWLAPWLTQHGVVFGDLVSVFRGGHQVWWTCALLLVRGMARAQYPGHHDYYSPVLDRKVDGASPVRWQPTTAWAVSVSVLALLSLLSLNQVTEFLYFQF